MGEVWERDLKWYKCRVIIKVDLKVLAFSKDDVKDIAIDAIVNEALPDYVEVLGEPEYKVTDIEPIEEKNNAD